MEDHKIINYISRKMEEFCYVGLVVLQVKLYQQLYPRIQILALALGDQ